jgi:alpha-mannosidase
LIDSHNHRALDWRSTWGRRSFVRVKLIPRFRVLPHLTETDSKTVLFRETLFARRLDANLALYQATNQSINRYGLALSNLHISGWSTKQLLLHIMDQLFIDFRKNFEV